ncbi:hypothetical protein ONS95_001353 [Cadophora gregata]|uniref:uncharacterized protein n=1 Tax=Cadophora gregata TaxID=51156 RepID=UPI0026DA92AB|nr:uncharacterized protein ONS95_001353 [Cadophora gregata]KAK0110972.1 hypothetical protein ONS95_001353 [Cadophora gregata]KAK0112568.1 hypothetical protein ONS96_001803 [Cadophora gregata f. sp. sojae]
MLVETLEPAVAAPTNSSGSHSQSEHTAVANEFSSVDVSFNFEEYLKWFDPSQKYKVRHLATGTNVTFLAIRQEKSKVAIEGKGNSGGQGQAQIRSEGIFPRSFIMKYSPPYFASSRGALPMTTYRQQVEAKALSLFGPGGKLDHISDRASINIPDFVRLDVHSHVLMESEMGGVVLTLTDLLQVSKIEGPIQTKVSLQTSFRITGNRIGDFLGDLHAPSTLAQIEDHHLKQFQHDGIKEFIYSANKKPIKDYLDFVQVADGVRIYGIIEHDFWHADNLEGGRVFALGDIGIDTILVSRDVRQIGIIGWQYSGPGRGLNGDIPKLITQIQVIMLAADSVQSPVYCAAKALLTGIASVYRCSSRRNLAPWSVSWDGNVGDLGSLQLPVETVSILRSAFIALGTEMIVAAMSMKRACKCQKETIRDGCKRRKKLVTEGCWHVRMAGNDDDAFRDNWEDICEKGSPLIPFVLGD